MNAHRADLERASGTAAFESQRDYLETVIELRGEERLSRIMYLAQAPADRVSASPASVV